MLTTETSRKELYAILICDTILVKDLNLNSFLSLIINEKHYKKDDFIKLSIFNFIELYFLKIFSKSKYKNNVLDFYSNFIRKINDTNKFNLDDDSLFMELKSKILKPKPGHSLLLLMIHYQSEVKNHNYSGQPEHYCTVHTK